MQINLSFFPSHCLGVIFHFHPSSATASFCTHCSGRGLGKENLNNRTFLGEDFLADDPRETREKYTNMQQRESGGEILRIVLFLGRGERELEKQFPKKLNVRVYAQGSLLNMLSYSTNGASSSREAKVCQPSCSAGRRLASRSSTK